MKNTGAGNVHRNVTKYQKTRKTERKYAKHDHLKNDKEKEKYET